MALQQVANQDANGNESVIISGGLPLPAGAATEATLAEVDGKLPANLGQKAMTASLAVVVASDQSTIPVSGAFYPATQPVSAVALPLPAGASTSAKQPAFGASGTASADVISVQGVSGMTPLQVVQDVAATGTLSSVAGSTSSSVFLASNVNRKGFSIFNDSTAILYLAFAATASSSAFSVKLQPNSYFENNITYTGVVSGIYSVALGNARITEFT